MNDLAAEKKRLRRSCSERRSALSGEERAVYSAAICEALRSLPEFCAARAVGLFAADAAEPELAALIDACPEKCFFLPRFVPARAEYEMAEAKNFARDCVAGRYGITEPRSDRRAASAEELRAMFWSVPGVAFDRSLRRLGRGGGFYDRLLAEAQGPVFGVCFSCQIVPSVPEEEHDRRMNGIVTEKEIIKQPEK